MSKTYYIYKITNTLSGKIYIGQTIKPKRRWYDHRYYAKHNKTNQYIHKAMNKYGINNFTFEIIGEFNSLDEANKSEAEFIHKFNSQNSKFGYNIRPGGRKKGWRHSEETKTWLSETWLKIHGKDGILAAHKSLKGRKLSEEHINSIRQANLGNKRLIGYKQPDKTIQKRIATIAKNYGSKVCSVPGCKRTDGYKHDGIRYCGKHIQRIIKNGDWRVEERTAWNKGKTASENTRQKMSKSLKGRKAPNKYKFTDDQIKLIMSYTVSADILAQNLKVSRNVIKRVRRENRKC